MMEPKIILLTTDGHVDGIEVFVEEDEYKNFCENILDGYDDDRCHSIQVKLSEIHYKDPYLQQQIFEKLSEKMAKILGVEQ